MKIIFLCGSLEPGHDGVGDYTRRLAGVLLQHGHQVAAIALNDKKVTEIVEGTQQAEDNHLTMLRIPGNQPADVRYAKAKNWIKNFGPDLLSLQFVPYSFHQKGVPFGLDQQLFNIYPEGMWHIMFHELWVGASGIKQRLISWAQQYIIKKCIKKLKPAVIHVSIPLNQQRIKAMGFKSNVLGLFGNISKAAYLANLPYATDAGVKKVLYFGGPPRTGFLEQVLNGLQVFCQRSELPVNIVLVSGTSKAKDDFLNLLNNKVGAYKGTVTDCGFVEESLLSSLMSTCNAGIIRSDPKYIGKSGSAISMLEHGLPIWMPKWDGKEVLEYDFRKELIHADLYTAANAVRNPEYRSLLPAIAQQFMNEITSTS
jgi:hypothetical protein